MAEEVAKEITLMSSYGKTFFVDELVAMKSNLLKNMIDDNCANGTIPLPNVDGNILSKVIDYCKKHVERAAKPAGDDKAAEEALKEWDSQYVNVDQATLFCLILAANYLNVEGLLDLTCQAVADMIKDKSSDEIRTLFNIKNDFTPEEEEESRKENKWAFD